jgi:hypothetical protein
MRTLDGAAELAAAVASSSPTRPEAVTALLGALLESIEGDPVTQDTVRALPSGTREWLLQWTAAHLNPELRWFEGRCSHCGEPFDLSIDLSSPVTAAPSTAVAEVTVETSLGTRRFAVPTGAHEEQYARMAAGIDSRRDFAAVCGLSPAAREEASAFDEHDLQLIDEALASVSPDIADSAIAPCPNCGKETECRVDPLLFAFPREADIHADVHLIASVYGWAHDSILRLPARHRTAYAAMIARERRAGQQAPGRRQ